MRQFGAGPVEHRHEVVADGGDAAGGEIAERLAVIVEQRLEVAFAELDRLGTGRLSTTLQRRPSDLSAAIIALRFDLLDVQTTP